MKKRVFVLDDEAVWRDFVTHALGTLPNIEVETFRDCAALKARLRRDQPDLFILDWNLPDGTGLTMVRLLREEFRSDVPAILFTSREAEADVVAALQMGADDFASKPVSAAILAARAEALLRRRVSIAHEPKPVERIANVEFDAKRQIVTFLGKDGGPHRALCDNLTAKEFELALLLFRSIGTPVSRDAIYAKIWKAEPSMQSRTLDAHIAQIRRKLELRPANGFQLSTIYGYGYRLERLEEAV